jgi:hypothetical protein
MGFEFRRNFRWVIGGFAVVVAVVGVGFFREKKGGESSWRRRWGARRFGKLKGRAGIENIFPSKEH